MIYNEINLPVTMKWKGLWNVVHRILKPTNEEVIAYSAENLPNALMDEGEQQVLEIFFRNNSGLGASPFFFGLGNNGGTPGVPAETVTLAGITEVSGTGYARIAVVRGITDWGATALNAGDYQTSSTTKQFQATGTWTAADYLFLCDIVSGTAGKLLVTVALSTSRLLVNGDKLDVSMVIKLQ